MDIYRNMFKNKIIAKYVENVKIYTRFLPGDMRSGLTFACKQQWDFLYSEGLERPTMIMFVQ